MTVYGKKIKQKMDTDVSETSISVSKPVFSGRTNNFLYTLYRGFLIFRVIDARPDDVCDRF